MKNFLLNRKVQKLFLPASFVCLFPLWLLLIRGAGNIPTAVYGLGILAAIFFILDRFFKPWEMERAEARMKKSQQAMEAQKSADETNDPPADS